MIFDWLKLNKVLIFYKDNSTPLYNPLFLWELLFFDELSSNLTPLYVPWESLESEDEISFWLYLTPLYVKLDLLDFTDTDIFSH